MATNQPSRMAKKQTAQKQKKKKNSNFSWKKFLGWAIAAIVALILIGIGQFAFYAAGAPELTEDDLKNNLSSSIYDDKSKEIKEVGVEKREYTDASQTPQSLKDAVVSIEDRRFYKHIGVDPIRIVGAAFSNVKGNTGLQGGSTLTQQLVKLTVFSTKKEDQTLKRKAQEAWLSIKLERSYSKEQILEFYMNKVYLANGVYGMGTASEYYYHKKLNDLSLPQVALLAGMPQAPNDYDPYKFPEKAKKRRDLVLSAMKDNGYITKEDMTNAQNTPIQDGLVEQKPNSNSSAVIDAYLKEVMKEVKDKTGYDIYTDGLKVYTNIDMDAQRKLYELANNNEAFAFPDDKMQVASTMVDVKTGQVKAMLGGRKQENVQLGLNRATQQTRSNGSTMKPLADYAPAIEYLNESTATTISDTAYNYPGTNIQLNDYDRRYKGTMTMREAIVDSRNIPAIKTLNKVGLTKSASFLSDLGMDFKDGMVQSNGIGGEFSTLQNAAAYAAFANGGTYYKPYFVSKIVLPDGTVKNYDEDGHRAMKDSTAYMITDMLKDVIKRGTGTGAQISGLYQAGKTGTTNYSDDDLAKTGFPDNSSPDTSFTGYTTNYSIAVWMGYDKMLENYLDPASQALSAKFYQALMSDVSQNTKNPDFEKPDSVVRVGNELYVNGYEPKKPSKDIDDSEPTEATDEDSTKKDTETDAAKSGDTSISSNPSDSGATSNPSDSSSSGPDPSDSGSLPPIDTTIPPINGGGNNQNPGGNAANQVAPPRKFD